MIINSNSIMIDQISSNQTVAIEMNKLIDIKKAKKLIDKLKAKKIFIPRLVYREVPKQIYP